MSYIRIRLNTEMHLLKEHLHKYENMIDDVWDRPFGAGTELIFYSACAEYVADPYQRQNF